MTLHLEYSPLTSTPENEFVDTFPMGLPSCHEVIELPLLLPEWQVDALEVAAKARGMTIGQLIRKMLSDVFPGSPSSMVAD